MSGQRWPPIDAGDETILDALNEANIPSLIATLVHLTGNIDIVRGDIRIDEKALKDLRGAGIAPEDQQMIKDLAFDVIRELRDGRRTLPAKPDEKTIKELINFLVNQELGEEYSDLLHAELSLEGEPIFSQPALDHVNGSDCKKFSVLVIGAGMSGILAAIKLKEAGFSYTVVEKNAEVGGTWFENTYPGCRVDSANHVYSYSFAPQDWPQYFSPQQVLLDYFKSVTEEYGIRDDIRFNTQVKRAVFNENSSLWEVTLEAEDGEHEVLEVNALISAVGQLNRPMTPDIQGIDTFKGVLFHSGHWEHEHDLAGKRIAVIGTGPSAFQFVPRISIEAAEVKVFQRTPPWVFPREDYHADIPAGKHWLLNNLPFYAHWYRFFLFWYSAEGMMKAAQRDLSWNEPGSVSAENKEMREMLDEYIHEMLGDDADLLAKSTPNYPPAAKRMVLDNGTWYRALKQENVNVITDPVIGVTEEGLKTKAGSLHEVDVVIIATGFHSTKFLWPMEIVGRNGMDIRSEWQDDPRAYRGVTVPNYPNFFMMYGPNTNIVVNGSIVFFSECEMRYILGCLAILLAGKHKTMEPKQVVHDAYNQLIDEGNAGMSWGIDGVHNWYKNESGRVTQNWPFSMREFWDQTKSANPEDYDFI